MYSFKPVFLQQGVRWSTAEHLIKNVEIAFNSSLMANSRFFEKVIRYLSRVHLTQIIKIHLNEFTKAWAVVIFESLSITKSLEQGIGVQNLFFNSSFGIHNSNMFFVTQ